MEPLQQDPCRERQGRGAVKPVQLSRSLTRLTLDLQPWPSLRVWGFWRSTRCQATARVGSDSDAPVCQIGRVASWQLPGTGSGDGAQQQSLRLPGFPGSKVESSWGGWSEPSGCWRTSYSSSAWCCVEKHRLQGEALYATMFYRSSRGEMVPGSGVLVSSFPVIRKRESSIAEVPAWQWNREGLQQPQSSTSDLHFRAAFEAHLGTSSSKGFTT